jgi:hypothetical protein
MSSLTTRNPVLPLTAIPVPGRWPALMRRWWATWKAHRLERQWLEMDTRILADIGMGEETVGAARAHQAAGRERLDLARRGLGDRAAWW